jgi:hypothetical protein
MQLMNNSCVDGDLRTELPILCSQSLVGLLRVSRLLFEVGVRLGDRTESLYPAPEFVGEVGVFMGQQPAFDSGFSSQLQDWWTYSERALFLRRACASQPPA